MSATSVPAMCSGCESGTIYVRLDLSGQDAPELAQCCDVCGSATWLEDAADLEARAADIIADRGT